MGVRVNLVNKYGPKKGKEMAKKMSVKLSVITVVGHQQRFGSLFTYHTFSQTFLV